MSQRYSILVGIVAVVAIVVMMPNAFTGFDIAVSEGLALSPQDELKQLQAEYDSLKQEIDGMYERLAELDEKVAKQTSVVESVQADINSLITKLGSIQTRMNNLRTAKPQSDAVKKQLVIVKREFDSTASTLDAKKALGKAERAALAELKKTVNAERKDVKKNIGVAERKLDSLKEQIKDLTDKYEKTSCVDSDGGKNYDVRGVTEGPEWATGKPVSIKDYCITDGEKAGRLAEGFCSNGQVATESIGCIRGCKDGACV